MLSAATLRRCLHRSVGAVKMADSSSDEGGSGDATNWVFYRNRPEWADVKATPQDEGSYPIVKIAYSDKFNDVFDYFRSVLRTGERSQRALDLTSDAADLNPANYTIWHYRRILLKDLGKDLKDELKYLDEMMMEHPKTYQLWHHRSVIVDWLHDPSEELAFTERVLRSDAKNYHAWQHRQWVVRTFSLWDNEMNYVNQLLEDDLRNNSAWNHRYFVIHNTVEFTDEVLKEEVKFTLGCIKKAVHNESAWNFLSGILYYNDISRYPGIKEFMTELYDSGVRSSYLLAFMVDLYENTLELGCQDSDAVLQSALVLCNALATKHDTIRSQYWKYVACCLSQKYGVQQATAS